MGSLDDRCGKCVNCQKFEHVRTSVLKVVNPPFSHADDATVKVWNDAVRDFPCVMPKPRLEKIVKEAELAFWAKVAALIPETDTGDFPPDVTFEFTQACETAVDRWVFWNVPGMSEEENAND